MNNEKPNTPILTQVYRIASGIAFILAFLNLVGGLRNDFPIKSLLLETGIFILAAIFALGIAEVIHLIAKIEFNTRQDSNEYQMIKLLSRISNNTEKDIKDLM